MTKEVVLGAGMLLVLTAMQFTQPIPELADSEIRAVEAAIDGSVWIADRERGLARWFDGALEWRDDVPLNGVADVYEDSRGRLWVAGLGGAALLQGNEWLHLPDPGGLGARVVFRISEEPTSGALWFATSAGAARLLGDQWSIRTTADGLPHAVVHAVHVTGDEVTWFACRAGLAREDEGGLTVFERESNFRTVLQGSGSDVWFGTSSGFRIWTARGLERRSEQGVVYPLLEGRDGALWAGSAGLGLFRSEDGAEWQPIVAPAALADAEVFDLTEDESGGIWVAASSGLWVFRSGGA